MQEQIIEHEWLTYRYVEQWATEKSEQECCDVSERPVPAAERELHENVREDPQVHRESRSKKEFKVAVRSQNRKDHGNRGAKCGAKCDDCAAIRRVIRHS
jgi:hypothetical protein